MRRFTAAVFLGVSVVAFLVSLALERLLGFPWGFVAGIVAGSAIGWWAGGRILYPLLRVGRPADPEEPPTRPDGVLPR